MRVLAVTIGRRPVVLAVCETVAITLAVWLGSWLVLGREATLVFSGATLPKALLITLVCQVSLYYADLYELRVGDHRELFVGIVHALSATSFVLAAIYFWAPSLEIAPRVFVASVFFVMMSVAGCRFAFEWLMGHTGPRERLLVVGTGPGAVSLARELFDRRQELGVEIVGFIDPDPSRVGAPVINPGVIGTIEDVPSIVRARNVNRVVVSLGDERGKLPMDTLLEMKLQGVSFDHLASVYEELTGKIAVQNLRPSWLIFSEGFRNSRWVASAKRLIDLAAALSGLLVAAPIMALVALAVRLTSPGPVLYSQQRVGRQGRLFTVYKFRSMRQDAEAATGAVWAQKNDVRVTPIGRFMRKTRLDELPQLWNVLVGDMSLVGPRPERPEFVQRLTEQIPFFGMRHVVRPGLTGWAQVRYSYGASVEDAMQKLQYDLFYIKNLSIALDLFIILSTIKTVILRKGAV